MKRFESKLLALFLSASLMVLLTANNYLRLFNETVTVGLYILGIFFVLAFLLLRSEFRGI